MIFLYIAIAWIVLMILFVIVWARFAARRRSLTDTIERDRLSSRHLRSVDDEHDRRRSDEHGGGAA